MKYEEMESVVGELISKLTLLNKKMEENDYENVAIAALDARKLFEDFREHLPMIKLIRSEAIMQDDWNLIREVVGEPELERETIRVQDFAEKHLTDHFSEIEDIVFRAEKKFHLQKQLKKQGT